MTDRTGNCAGCPCCESNNLSDSGCSVGLNGVPKSRRIVDGSLCQENHQLTGKLCDRMISFYLNDRQIGLVIELKNRNYHASDVVSQLRAGAAVLERMTEADCHQFMAVLVARRFKAAETKVLSSQGIRFGGRSHRILTKKCGGALVQWLPAEWTS